MIRVLELFAGIGACSKALTNLGIEHEIVDAVEIDKYAVKSFNAIHGTNFEPQDITKWNKDVDVDLIMHGSPCQDFSVAGKGAGGDKDSGTRSSLMYETLRIVEKLKPKYVIWENVKNLLSAKHRHNFDAYLEAMERLGYRSRYQVLNAKDYGVPQNRERVFTVSIRNDLDVDFKFPEPQELTIRLKDVLEPQVDEKYYLSDEQVSKIKLWEDRQKENGRGFRFNAKDGDEIATTMTTSADRPSTSNYYKDPKEVRVAGKLNQNPENPSDRSTGQKLEQRLEPNTQGITNTITSVQKDNYVAEPVALRTVRNEFAKRIRKDYESGKVKARRSDMKQIEPRKDGVTNTLTSVQKDNYIAKGFRIRKLTPKECWRLMGFSDEDFEKAQSAGISNSQLYKQAGNSIVVNVLEGILRNLPIDQ